MTTILKMLWSLFGPTLLKLAISMGLPEADKFMKEHGFPDWLRTGLMAIVTALLGEISSIKADTEATPAEKQERVVNAVGLAARRASDTVVAGPSGIVRDR